MHCGGQLPATFTAPPQCTHSHARTHARTARFSTLLRGVSWKYAHVTNYVYPLQGVDDIWDLDICTVRTDSEDLRKSTEELRKSTEELRSATAMRSYPKADEEEGKRLFEGQEISLKPPKLWPRYTLLEMLSREPVKDIKGVCTEEFVITLLEKKWLMYAGVQLMAQLTLHLAFLALLCAVVVLRAVPMPPPPEGGEGGQGGGAFLTLSPAPLAHLQRLGFGATGHCSAAAGSQQWCLALVVAEALLVACNWVSTLQLVYAVIMQAVVSQGENSEGSDGELHTHLLSYFSDSHGSTSFGRHMSLLVGLLVHFCCWLVHSGKGESPLFFLALSFTCVMGWLSLLRYAMGWEMLAHFVVMIKEMVMNDLMRFLGVAGVLLLAFAHAFFILGHFSPGAFGTVLFRSLMALVGEGEVEVDREEGPRLGYTAFQVAYLISGSLMLLNVLIAMSACASPCSSAGLL